MASRVSPLSMFSARQSDDVGFGGAAADDAEQRCDLAAQLGNFGPEPPRRGFNLAVDDVRDAFVQLGPILFGYRNGRRWRGRALGVGWIRVANGFVGAHETHQLTPVMYASPALERRPH